MNEKNLKIIRYLTGAMFISIALQSFPLIVDFVDYWGSVEIMTTLFVISIFVGALLIAISMFSNNYILLMVGAGMMALGSLNRVIAGGGFYRIFWVFANALLVVATFQRERAVKIGIISALLSIIAYISAAIFHSSLSVLGSAIFTDTDTTVLDLVRPLLVCLVLQNTPQAEAAKISKPATAPKASNRIEELTKLKDLLDAGAITQEEFDAKKKQLLNL